MSLRGAFLDMFGTRVARRLLQALLLAAILPLVSALGVGFLLLEFSIGVGLNETVEEALQSDVPLYGALFEAKRSEYRAAGRALALEAAALGHPPADRDLLELLGRHAELGALAVEAAGNGAPPVEDADGEETPAPAPQVVRVVQAPAMPAGRPFDVREPLPGGLQLHARFVLPARFDQGLAHSRDLAETFKAVRNARGAILRGLLLTFVAVVVFVLLGAAFLAGIIARSITRKVAVLSDAAREAAHGNLSVRVDEHWYDELGDLARAFNRMLGEIAEGRDRIVYLEKISGWQEVARRLAHEIKNPLTPMVLAVQELAEKVPAQPEAYARLVRTAREIVEEEATTLRRLVQEFSDFARLPDVRVEPTDLCAFCRDYLESARDVAAAADARLEAPAGPLWTALDRALFRRVLQNLVANAVEAQGGSLRPGDPVADPRPRAWIRLTGPEHGWLTLSVDDAGPGVPAADRHRIFEPYVTGKRTGTGLGLAIVKKLVLQHGGTIHVVESPDGGARFMVRLPGVAAPANLAPAS
ncbi:MAG: HAMP domain-containing protein [Deltaproteobacteria bacterium]|nr:HAMP domain-containing protein [Deltaproteobacteria bacterium]